MDDATPSATPRPEQPVATATNPEAPFPPADSLLPVFVPPSVTDPVSNLDFPPVDDAFALEMRAQTIEQLVGGDALRRGESERIEAGRSQTNADLVAGRDRVRVQGTLHEHTGHGRAEQAAHLHTTVNGALEVHAGSEDTVLLAGHMRELWDGGAAIVAAMTDDTVAGGGIRVTTPLDLWVHGVMGVEERIGTCTADAVLLELGATHYEREYGPGVHAAGLAAYIGSLYQSSRSTFRPLMRVSSGVRNLVAGGGGGSGGGHRGAGDAPAASPPPVPAETGAATKSVTGTLAAGRRAAEAPATALDTADALTDARRAPLDELVSSVDARASEETGEAGIVMCAEDLPGLTRSADTVEQLGALRETLRMGGSASASDAAGGFRTTKFDDAGSMRPATGGGGPLEIDPPSAVCGENAPIMRPHPGNPQGAGPEMNLGLPAGADRPAQSAAPTSDFTAALRRLRELRGYYYRLPKVDIAYDFKKAVGRITRPAVSQFRRFGGREATLMMRPSGINRPDHAYRILQEMARQAENEGDLLRAGAIRQALDAIDERAVGELQALRMKHGIAEAPTTRAMQRPSATTESTATVAAIPPPTPTPMQFDWGSAYRQLRNLSRRFSDTGRIVVGADFQRSAERISGYVLRRFRKFGGDSEYLVLPSSDATTAEQMYHAMEDLSRRATESGEITRAYQIRQSLELINRITSEDLDELATRHGAPDALSTRDIGAMQQPPPSVGPTTSPALPATVRPPSSVPTTTVPPPGRLDISVPAHTIALEVNPAFAEPSGGLVHTTGVPGPPPASGVPGPSFAETAGADAGDLGRWWLGPPATVSVTTAAEPVAVETTVTPSLAGTSSLWLQPVDPVPAPGTVVFDSGLHHAGMAVRPPPVTVTASSTAPALSPGAAFPTPSWADDDFAVERALLAGKLPPRFDTSQFVIDASMSAEFGLAEELAAGWLPFQTIDAWIAAYRATGEGGSNTVYIEQLLSLKESIERALRDAYPRRVGPQWLDQVQELLGPGGDPAAPSAASAGGLPELEATEIDRLLGTGEGVPHPAATPVPCGSGAPRRGRRGAPPRRRPVGHSTAGDGRRAVPGRLRPLVRASRPQPPGRAYRGDTHSGDVDRRTAGVAGRRDARLRQGGLGRRRAPVLAPRGVCPPVRDRGRIARRRGHASNRRNRHVRLVRYAVARGVRRPPLDPRRRPVGRRGSRGQGRRRLARGGGADAHVRCPVTVTQPGVAPHDDPPR